MRIDESGQAHPTLGDEVSAVGLAHLDTCAVCRGHALFQSDLTEHREMMRVATNDLVDRVAMNQTAISPVRGVESFDGAEWQPMIPSVCDICGANVFTVNMGPHKEWHGRMMG